MCIPACSRGGDDLTRPGGSPNAAAARRIPGFPSDIPAQCGGHVHHGRLTSGEAASTRDEKAKGQIQSEDEYVEKETEKNQPWL